MDILGYRVGHQDLEQEENRVNHDILHFVFIEQDRLIQEPE